MYFTFNAFTLGIVEVRYRWAMQHEDSQESINISGVSVFFSEVYGIRVPWHVA